MLDLLKEIFRAKRKIPHHYQTLILLSIRILCMKMGLHSNYRIWTYFVFMLIEEQKSWDSFFFFFVGISM